MKFHVTRTYLYAVALAAVNLAVLFGVPLAHDQEAGISLFLAVVFGVDAAYNDPRVPIGRK